MAIEFVEGLGGASANGANVTITFVDAQDDDVALVIGGHSSTGLNAGVVTAGYTEIMETGSNARMSISWKRLSGDTSVTCLGGGDTDDAEAYVVMVFRGVHASTPIDAATPDPASGSSGEPNPPAITTVTDGAAIVACFIINEVNGSVLNGPAGYGDLIVQHSFDVNDIRVGAAWFAQPTAGTENPGQFDFSPSPAASWRAGVVALRPAVEGSFGDGALSGGTNLGTASFVGARQTEGIAAFTGTGTATLKGNALVSRVGAFTGTGTASWVGTSLATSGRLAATGTGTMSARGGLDGAGDVEATGTVTTLFIGDIDVATDIFESVEWTVSWVGATSRMSSVRETIESRGAATVNIA